jgi:hypothetical protein
VTPDSAHRKPRPRELLRRLLRRSRSREAAPTGGLAAVRELGEPPAPGAADDAELDALRGELVRELDRMAADRGGSAGFRRC